MTNVFNILANILVAGGIVFQVWALFIARRLIRRLPQGPIIVKWYGLTGLMVFFLTGYIAYPFFFWNHHAVLADIIVPGIFLLGGGFVWAIVELSLETAIDLRRIALLEKENITDPLIGIYNRRYMVRRMEEEFSRAKRYQDPLSLLLLDIDHFKKINDNYGHQGGDEVLRNLGMLVLNTVRESDIVTRYGGEELLIIAPNTNLNTAVKLAERMRHHVESHELVLTSEAGTREVIQTTVSIGVADLTSDPMDCTELVRNADEALYRAKQEGRNRVIAYRPDNPKPKIKSNQ